MPVVLFFFGGGWVVGGIDESQAVSRKLANRAPCIVISVGYRLAPENPFPAALEDGAAAFRWARQHVQEWGGDPDRIGVCGESAGGNLSAALCLYLRDRKEQAPAFQLPIYPVTTRTLNPTVYEQSLDQHLLTQEKMAWYWNQYLPKHDVPDIAYASLLEATNFSNLPPALFILAEHDPLTPEGEAYAEALRKAGVEVSVSVYPKTIHGFVNPPYPLKAADQACDELARWVR